MPTCEIHGEHAGIKIGRNATDKCPKCVNEQRGKRISGAAKAKRESVGTPESVPLSSPRTSGIILTEADFAEHPKMLEDIKVSAIRELRTVSNQILWYLKCFLENERRKRTMNWPGFREGEHGYSDLL